MKQTWGVPVEEIQLGIRHGVRKINVDTDSRLAITGAIRKELFEKPEEFDPRYYLKPAREAMKQVVAAAHDGVRPGRPRRRLHADPARGDARALRQRLDRVSLADIDAGLRAAGAPALVALVVERLGLDEDDIAAATRRGLLLAAAAGDPAEGIAPGSRAVLETAAELDGMGVTPALVAGLRELAGAAGLPIAAAAAAALAEDPEAALGALALVLLSLEVG